MVPALILAAVASVTSLADEPAAAGPPSSSQVSARHTEGASVDRTGASECSGFFSEVRRKVAKVWNPMDAARAQDPTGSRHFKKDRKTVLAVTIDRQGTILRMKVVRSSGLDFLDQTTLDAFRAAQPFLGAPEGMADSLGEVGFRFGFHVRSTETRGAKLVLQAGPIEPTPAEEAFYEKVELAVADRWRDLFAAEKWKLVDGPAPTQDNHGATALGVVLDPAGRVVRIQVKCSSGFDFLDQLAIDSVRQARAFPDPPLGPTGPGTGLRFPLSISLSGARNADWSSITVVLE